MSNFTFQVLGANSATPMIGRFPSSFVLQYNLQSFLIDCGEGSQMKMSEFHVKKSRIDFIFISHMHGDHIFGLPGLLNSYTLNNRERPLHLFGPVGIAQYINTIHQLSGAYSSYELNIHELADEQVHDLGLIGGLKVKAFPLKHRIPTFGYRFDEVPQPPNIDSAAISKYNLSIQEIKTVKKGGQITRDGKAIAKDELLLPPKPLRSFAYCSDTIYDPDIIKHIQRATLIYHEATYLHELAEKARARMHCTVYEAALIARRSNVSALIIGHYSSRYKNLEPLLAEAKDTFENSFLATEGTVFEVKHI